jgi:hypothetical protein
MSDFPLQPMAGKGHVPEENLARYRRLRELGFLFSRLGNMVSGLGEYDDANKIWAMGGKYSRMANDLRVDLPATTATLEEILKAQIAESLPDCTPEQVDELYQMGLELKRRLPQEGTPDAQEG